MWNGRSAPASVANTWTVLRGALMLRARSSVTLNPSIERRCLVQQLHHLSGALHGHAAPRVRKVEKPAALRAALLAASKSTFA